MGLGEEGGEELTEMIDGDFALGSRVTVLSCILTLRGPVIQWRKCENIPKLSNGSGEPS